MIDSSVIKKINDKYKDNPVKERLAIAAAIQTELQTHSNDAVVVGGSAVEFYSAASYMTKDLDFIVKDDFNVKLVMTGLGFKNDGDGIWYHDDSTVIVEFPKGPLIGDLSKLTHVETPFGTAKIIGIEDIIIDRASAVKYWKDSSEWTEYLLSSHYDNIDIGYLREQAQKLNCADIVEKIINTVHQSLNTQKDVPEKTNKKFNAKETEKLILKLLNQNKEVHQIIRILSMDEKIPGEKAAERCNYVRKIIETNAVIKHKIKQLDQDYSR